MAERRDQGSLYAALRKLDILDAQLDLLGSVYEHDMVLLKGFVDGVRREITDTLTGRRHPWSASVPPLSQDERRKT